MFSNYKMPEILMNIPEIRCCYEIAAEMTADYIYFIKNKALERQTDTATEKGISRKEKMYGLKFGSTDTLEEKRMRIQLHEMRIKYLNEAKLVEILYAVAGEDVSISVDKTNENVTVYIALTSIKQTNFIEKLVKQYIPVDWNCTVIILYNRYSAYNEMTHSQLQQYTHNQLRNEVF